MLYLSVAVGKCHFAISVVGKHNFGHFAFQSSGRLVGWFCSFPRGAFYVEVSLWRFRLCGFPPNFSQCYIGQTGTDSFRCVFDRGKERLVNTRDWTLLHRSKRGRIPLYEWVNKVGVHNVTVTPLERIPTWAADSREIFLMYRFGTSHLLNRSIPNLRQTKWAWLLKTKSFAKTLKKSESATANTKARADSFIRSGHCTLTLHEMVQLVLDTKAHDVTWGAKVLARLVSGQDKATKRR